MEKEKKMIIRHANLFTTKYIYLKDNLPFKFFLIMKNCFCRGQVHTGQH